MITQPRTLPAVLRRRAESTPTKTFLRTPTRAMTYEQAHERVESLAAGFQRRGISAGDRVVVVMVNSMEQVIVWFALNRIGAVNVPINAGLTPALIARSCEFVHPVAVVADADLVDAIPDASAEPWMRETPIFVNGDADTTRPVEPITALTSDTAVVEVQIDELSAATMLFTSGSTGVPKACVLSHRYLRRAGEIHTEYLELEEDDVLFTPFPLFHIDAATLTVSAALAAGATAALSTKFSASRFWDDVRATEATVFNYMGATANILWKQPPSPSDRDHRVRLAWGVPMPACGPRWADRFGFELVEVYGLTDAGVPAYQPLHQPRISGSCGRIIPEYTVRIADADGAAVPTGSTGEILIRSSEAGLLMSEYHDMPEATAVAFRDGWFHTGDLGQLDSDDNLFFVTRSKEVIRRRGENIAAIDIEEAVDAHPGVRESAAVGVPSELSEDDIKVFYVPQPGVELDPAELFEHCRKSLPRHMWPRYLEQSNELPKTPTEKIERFKLAARPASTSSWDVDSAPRTHSTRTTEEALS